MRVETKEEEFKRLSEIENETQKEATARIGEELRAKTKLQERKDFVMNYYFELVGVPMTEAEFELYNKIFEKAKAGYSIKSFIRDQKIKLSPEKSKNYNAIQDFEEFCKKEEIRDNVNTNKETQ